MQLRGAVKEMPSTITSPYLETILVIEAYWNTVHSDQGGETYVFPQVTLHRAARR